MAASDRISLFDEKKPFAASAVWACVVYSLVPFVGVLFVPIIFVLAVIGLIHREAAALRAVTAGVVILIFQLVLWWLMYAVPKWGAVT